MPKQHQPRKTVTWVELEGEKKKKKCRRRPRPGSRDLARPTRSLSLPLWSDYFSLSYLVSLSLIWVSLFWSGEAWNLEIFKKILNYKSSLKDSIFKWSTWKIMPHQMWFRPWKSSLKDSIYCSKSSILDSNC